MTFKNFFLLFLFCSQWILAQDTIAKKLQEVIVSSKNLPFYLSQKSKTITDSIIDKSEPILGEVLKNNSLLYFKEYGRGMLSTVSFRGTTASQTAVMWNGVNINSPLNGSVDFNTIGTNGIQSIDIKPGGGSVLYGSGAIGGSVHLNNRLIFNGKEEHRAVLGIGSFDTYQGSYSGIISTNVFSVNIGFSHFQSENNYDYKGLYTWKGVQRRNENGQFKMSEMNVGFGYKWTKKSILKLFSQTSLNDRNIALVTESDPTTKYTINYSRNLLDYTYASDKLTISPKLAYVTENYQYFPDNNQVAFYSFGQSNTFIGKLNLNYQPYRNTTLYVVSENTTTHGFGTSFGNNSRSVYATAISINQNVFSNWKLEAGVKNEITSAYKSPLLFSIGSTSVFDFYTLKINASKNFRVPTFNDLYWDVLGNPNLKPETSLQGEMSNQFKIKKIILTATVYYNQIQDMIRWIPFSSEGWKPVNIDNVNVLGFEGGFSFEKKFNSQHFLKINGEYSYTQSINAETQKQLTYTPYQRFIANIDYSYKGIAFFVQDSFVGSVFATSDNSEEYSLKSYNVWNIGLKIRILKNFMQVNTTINNLLDLKYTSIDRPMPGRNYNFQLTFKI